jgi:hypothetical protein
MTDDRFEDRRASDNDRRAVDMDRRQFVNITWSRDKERRLEASVRREGTERRG